jgi:glycosyltransferase involved in cell wall biosynthesis
MRRHYREAYGVKGRLIAYGAAIIDPHAHDRLAELGLEPHGYHLVVARFESENRIHVVLEAYRRSGVERPLVVVGSAPYAAEYSRRIAAIADGGPGIRMLGSVWDQELLDQLYANAYTYLHGHSVGGTNPSLLRAMGAGSNILALDVVFNREVLGDAGAFFTDADDLARSLAEFEADAASVRENGRRACARAAQHYRWEAVALQYEQLCADLAARRSER